MIFAKAKNFLFAGKQPKLLLITNNALKMKNNKQIQLNDQLDQVQGQQIKYSHQNVFHRIRKGKQFKLYLFKQFNFYRLWSLTLKSAYFTATQKQNQKISPNALTEEQKLNYLKGQLQSKLNKMNLKAVLKLYNLLLTHQTKFTQTFEENIKQKIQNETSSLDQQGVLWLLEILHKQKKYYQKHKRVFRTLNALIVKGKKKIQVKNIFKILKLMSLLQFPKNIIGNFISTLVIDQSIKQRLLYQMTPNQLLKTALVGLQLKQVSLQIKKRILQCIVEVKYQSLPDLVYLYHICQLLPKCVQQSAKHQSIKKTVYDIAFNPYSNVNVGNQEVSQQQKAKTSNQKTYQNKNKKQYNEQILKQRNQYGNTILHQFFAKISPQNILKYIDQKLGDLQSQIVVGLSFNVKKQIASLLVLNHTKSKNIQKFVQFFLQYSLNGTGLNVDEFIRLIILVEDGKKFFNRYVQKYYSFMSLEQKLMIKHYGKKIFNIEIQINQIMTMIQDNTQSLNSQEFRCLLRVIQHFKKDNLQVKKTILELLLKVQNKVDNQIERLKRQNIKEQVRKQSQQQNSQKEKNHEK